MAEEIIEAIRNAFNEYLNAVDKIILENQALQIEFQHLKQENKIYKQSEEEAKEIIAEFKQENEELKENIKQYCNWLDEERESNDKLQQAYQSDHCDVLKYRSTLEEINRVVKLAHKVEDYSLEQDYTDLVDRIEKEIDEVLNK